jgi:hypothetical protein
MFSNPNLKPQNATFSSIYNTPTPKAPSVFTNEVRDGLTKAISAYTIVNGNCNLACKSALEYNDLNRLDLHKKQTFDSCVRRCFVQRLKNHIPEENQLTEFVYSTAFGYSQENQFFLNLNGIDKLPTSNEANFKDIEQVALSFNKTFV